MNLKSDEPFRSSTVPLDANIANCRVISSQTCSHLLMLRRLLMLRHLLMLALNWMLDEIAWPSIKVIASSYNRHRAHSWHRHVCVLVHKPVKSNAVCYLIVQKLHLYIVCLCKRISYQATKDSLCGRYWFCNYFNCLPKMESRNCHYPLNCN